jgi:hypothetical protein
MADAVYGEWVVDLDFMTCWNPIWDITVAFERQGKGFKGKISYMPDELIKLLVLTTKKNKILKKAVRAAEDVFNRAMGNEQRGMGKEKRGLFWRRLPTYWAKRNESRG